MHTLDMEHLSLYELNKKISEALANNLEPSYWVVAEIGQMQTNRKGHCYLELVEKEDDQIKAKTRATIWSYTYRNLSTWFEGITGQSLKSGMKILFNATIQYHEIYGFSLNIRDIDAQYTLGERAKKRQEIIERLREDGIFEMNKELSLPTVPQNIAVISSETAAGFGDFMDQIGGNDYGYEIKIELFNAVMQGEDAASSIIDAMHQVFENIGNYDLLVIIRGGGATLDLDCFDNYDLGSHVAQFPIPVITGIGHERDETITDMVAHTKMKTPTAVAEFIISGFRNIEIELMEKFNFLSGKLDRALDEESQNLDQLLFRFQRSVQQKLNVQEIKLSKWIKNLHYGYQNALKVENQKLNDLKQSIKRSPSLLIRNQTYLEYLEKEINVLDPQNVLKRGYSITTVNGKNVTLVKKIVKDTKMITLTSNRKIESKYISDSERKS
jgi:exodeoxyribonuclease VII large subunit